MVERDWYPDLPEKVVGFRLDGIRPNGTIGFYGAPESTCPRIGDRPVDGWKWTPAAFCVQPEHSTVPPHVSPYRRCKCGWFVTTDMQELSEYTTAGYGLDVSCTTVDYIQRRPVVVEVTAHGPKMAAGRDDPLSTFRATWVSLNGRCWIRDDIPQETVKRTQGLFPFLKIERFHHLSEVPAMVERTQTAYQPSQKREWFPIVDEWDNGDISDLDLFGYEPGG
ncbi:hypothetical protein ABZV91_02675 [Nocardia sp. NPDC004568]|uniref:hypothetical protein n=1 Tax=Nocardia sp. NPDC004568 TaxID=3154551 RepID=UPI0033AB6B5B